MSKTKLMQLRPARSRICCRDRGKVSKRKVSSDKSLCKRNVAGSPLDVLRKATLNPPKETMVPLTYQDFINVGYLHNTSASPEFEFAKYHAELIHGDVEVTLPMLKTKWLEINKRLGIPVTNHQRTGKHVTRVIGRFRLYRFAKCQGYDISIKSLNLVRPMFLEIISREEPVNARSVHKMVNAHCTCTPEAKVLSKRFLQEDDGSHNLERQSMSSNLPTSTKTPDMNNLFATPSLNNLFTMPSVLNHDHTAESDDEEESTAISKPTGLFMYKHKKILCAFCQHKLNKKFFTSKTYCKPDHVLLRFEEYIYTFPELLPECPDAMEQPEHQMVLASEQEPILLSDDDDAYSALYYISHISG